LGLSFAILPCVKHDVHPDVFSYLPILQLKLEIDWLSAINVNVDLCNKSSDIHTKATAWEELSPELMQMCMRHLAPGPAIEQAKYLFSAYHRPENLNAKIAKLSESQVIC
jgi:hypothetical protein